MQPSVVAFMGIAVTHERTGDVAIEFKLSRQHCLAQLLELTSTPLDFYPSNRSTCCLSQKTENRVSYRQSRRKTGFYHYST